MDVGFDTIGNATLICYDRGPVLVTDPWIVGSAYFGSWGLSHEVPDEQEDAVRNCQYVWISHGHPDHLNADSEPYYVDKKILLPDHAGGRIRRRFQEAGLDVTVLKDRVWHRLSERIRVLCLANYMQDGILLIDVGGQLLVNMNDANWQCGWLWFIRGVVKRFDQSFLLHLTNHGDADMINIRDEDGRLLLSSRLAEKPRLDGDIQRQMDLFGTSGFIPFSSLHRYQRTDSVWAQEHTVRLDEYGRGPGSFPAFIRYCCGTDRFEELAPCPASPAVHEPEDFGDHWGDELDKDDAQVASRYSGRSSTSATPTTSSTPSWRQGQPDRSEPAPGTRPDVRSAAALAHGRDTGRRLRRSAHRQLHAHDAARLDAGSVPALHPYVAKYADNGGARAKREVKSYMEEYRRRAPLDFLLMQFSLRCKNLLRPHSAAHRVARAGYRRILPKLARRSGPRPSIEHRARKTG